MKAINSHEHQDTKFSSQKCTVKSTCTCIHVGNVNVLGACKFMIWDSESGFVPKKKWDFLHYDHTRKARHSTCTRSSQKVDIKLCTCTYVCISSLFTNRLDYFVLLRVLFVFFFSKLPHTIYMYISLKNQEISPWWWQKESIFSKINLPFWVCEDAEGITFL